ncbi:Kinetochore protein mis18 [Trichoplax sp. H2]|nr:Kinetochore protein mis18 [Trichoplax sp. H2]|eukprot:RDD39418.1 Kinetochore protein mis18 [Trichoplax sp. H2]
MEEELKDNPAVLQCNNCFNIVGDTLSAVDSNDDIEFITLDSVTDAVDVGTKLVTLKRGSRKGCSYQRLACYHCNTVLGRKYQSPFQSKSPIQSRYAFKLNKLKIYHLGQFISKQETDVTDNSVSAVSTASDTNMEKISSDLFKMKHLLLLLSQRVDRLEASAGIP